MSLGDHLCNNHAGARKPTAKNTTVSHRDEDLADDNEEMEEQEEQVVALPIAPYEVEASEYSNSNFHKCPLCKDTFHKLVNLEAHMQTMKHFNNFTCKICLKPFVTEVEVIEHFEQQHMNGKKCEDCSKRIRGPSDIGGHVRKLHMTQNYPYICQVCNLGFKRSIRLRDHELVHSEEKPFQCNECEMAYRWKRNLIAHEKKAHGISA